MTGNPSGSHEGNRFPKPDWDAIGESIGDRPLEALHLLWVHAAKVWAEDIRSALGPGHELRETEHFIVVARGDYESLPRVLAFLEACFRCIGEFLPFTTPRSLLGKCVVILFASDDDFYEYVATYLPEDGAYGMMVGVYLNHGYGHFALPYDDMGNYEYVVSHELSHAFLSQFQLPLWLDEAITAETEHHMTGRNPYVLNREIIRRHRAYWDAGKIDAFWTGDSFWFPDEGQELSYHLCRYVLHALQADLGSEAMAAFVERASRDNAGFSAAADILDADLGQIVNGLLTDDR